VSALKIREIHVAQLPRWKGATCRGSCALGSACGHCERCRWERSEHIQPGSAVLISDHGPVPVTLEYMSKHKPEAGGYFVIYGDGYESFSPARAFEEGYTLIES
jgi:hypothetical protein